MEPNQPSTDLMIPDEFRLKSILETIQRDKNIPSAQRRKLIKQQYELLITSVQEQFKVALAIEKDRLGGQEMIAHRQLVVDVEIMTFQIRNLFLDAVATLGENVEMKQLDCLAEFAKKLKVFRNKLSTLDIDENEKSTIEELSKNAFNRVKDKLIQLTADIIDRAVPP